MTGTHFNKNKVVRKAVGSDAEELSETLNNNGIKLNSVLVF